MQRRSSYSTSSSHIFRVDGGVDALLADIKREGALSVDDEGRLVLGDLEHIQDISQSMRDELSSLEGENERLEGCQRFERGRPPSGCGWGENAQSQSRPR